MSQYAPDDEWGKADFLRVIGGGYTDPNVSLAFTNFTLGDILYDIENPK